jgi:hypothetical protein
MAAAFGHQWLRPYQNTTERSVGIILNGLKKRHAQDIGNVKGSDDFKFKRMIK